MSNMGKRGNMGNEGDSVQRLQNNENLCLYAGDKFC